jgi:hypothetical protein
MPLENVTQGVFFERNNRRFQSLPVQLLNIIAKQEVRALERSIR